MIPCVGAASILDFTRELGSQSAQLSLVAIMIMFHLIWSHQNVFHQHCYEGWLYGYSASQCLPIWIFLLRNKLDWFCRLLMVYVLLKLTTFPCKDQALKLSVLSSISVRYVVDGSNFSENPDQYGFSRILVPRKVLCLQAATISVGLFIILITGIHQLMELSRVSTTQMQLTFTLVGVSGPVNLLQPPKLT